MKLMKIPVLLLDGINIRTITFLDNRQYVDTWEMTEKAQMDYQSVIFLF